MERANQLICPNCGASLTSVRGVRIGKKIKCLKCGVAFTVRPEDAEKGGGLNAVRLCIVLAAALIYLLGGAAMAVYCFTDNRAANGEIRADIADHDTEVDNGVDTMSAPPDVPAMPKPGTPSAAEQRKIDDAITAGVWYLRDQALPTGGWANDSVGFAALPGLTLLECGVPANEPVIQRAAALVRREVVAAAGAGQGTYQLALAILFLDRLAAYEDDDLIRYLALCLIAGQHPTDGGWHYSCPRLDRAKVPQLLQMLADDKQSLPEWRKTALGDQAFNADGWDNSNTQFAVLALWVAKRHQVAIDKPIALVEQHFRTTQMGDPAGPAIGDPDGNNVNLNGSWYYDTASASGWRNSSRWPSMTCSGLLGLAIGHGVTRDPAEQKQKPLDDPAIQRGLAMLAREIARPDEKRPPDFYYLWSLQRVAGIFELNAIGGKDWYPWGVNILLPLQHTDGSWQDGGFVGSHPILNTCFALMFLKRANLAKDLADKLQLLARLIDGAPPSVQAPPKKE
jgi:hypothetical protein